MARGDVPGAKRDMRGPTAGGAGLLRKSPFSCRYACMAVCMHVCMYVQSDMKQHAAWSPVGDDKPGPDAEPWGADGAMALQKGIARRSQDHQDNRGAVQVCCLVNKTKEKQHAAFTCSRHVLRNRCAHY